MTRNRWRELSTADKVRYVVLLVVKAAIIPLQVVFYVIRSAWIDSDSVGWWIAPSCKHGKRPTEDCMACKEAWIADQIKQALRHNKDVREN